MAALRAAVPGTWGTVVILAVASRWRPLTNGIPVRYRAERQRVLREIWTEQTEHARTRLAEMTAAKIVP